jgi:hypothetical protein
MVVSRCRIDPSSREWIRPLRRGAWNCTVSARVPAPRLRLRGQPAAGSPRGLRRSAGKTKVTRPGCLALSGLSYAACTPA